MRNIKQLLELMLANPLLFKWGLCNWSMRMLHTKLITLEEEDLLFDYIQKNRPFWNKLLRGKERYYWPQGDIKPRIKWLKHHIKKNSHLENLAKQAQELKLGY